jgi:hypothetical protein
MQVGKTHHNFKDIAGKRYGILTAVKPLRSVKGSWQWLMLCDCGKSCAKQTSDLQKEAKKGRMQNCGCLTRLLIGQANTTHGMSGHPLYIVWRNMRNRCYKEWEPAYKNYGARGITVCVRWRDSFENFSADMQSIYAPGLTLERRNNGRGYSPSNCYWATCTEQAQNTRNTIRTVNVPQLAEQTGISRSTIYYRLQHGWPVSKLKMKPDLGNGKKKLYTIS